jgi:hypothetical protein
LPDLRFSVRAVCNCGSRFSHLAGAKKICRKGTRDKYFRQTGELGSNKRHPESVTKSRGSFDRGQAMPGTRRPGIATYLTKGIAFLYLLDQRTSWWKPMFDAVSLPDLTDGLSRSRMTDVRKDRLSDRDLQRASYRDSISS